MTGRRDDLSRRGLRAERLRVRGPQVEGPPVEGPPGEGARARARRWRAAVAALALSVALSGCDLSLQSLPKFSAETGRFYTLHATFADVLNLPAEAKVRDGVATIGQVSAISTHDFVADVTLEIRAGVRLPVGTRAQVQFDDPLGDEYVEMLTPPQGHGPYLADGARLSEGETSSAPSIADTLAALSTVLNGGGINQLHTIVTELDATFAGHQPELRNLLVRVEDTFGSLARHHVDLDGALSALANLARQLNAGTPTIVEGIDTLAPAVNVLASDNGQLRDLLGAVDRLAVVANGIADRSGAAAVADVHDLLPVVDQLVEVDREVGPALADISTFEALTPKIAPGNSLQVSLDATAVLPGASPAATTAALSPLAPRSGSAAVTALLEAGLP